MKKNFAMVALAGAALSLTACGSSDDASADANAESVESVAEEALADVTETPVEDDAATAEAAEPAAVDQSTAEEAAANAAEIAAAVEAAEASASDIADLVE